METQIMVFSILVFIVAYLWVPCFANISTQVMNQLLIEKQAIFTNFPKLSDTLEESLSICFESLSSNSQWSSCLAQVDDDSCICEIYQLASEKCIKRYINDTEYINVFTTSVKESCSFGIEKNRIAGSNKIVDFEDSDHLKISSSEITNLPLQMEGFFGSNYEEFQNCYKDIEKNFDICLKNASKSAGTKQIDNCECEFAEELQNNCSQYSSEKLEEFGIIFQKLCKNIKRG